MEANSTASLSLLLSMYSCEMTSSSLSTNASSTYSQNYPNNEFSNLTKLNKIKSGRILTTSKWISTKLRATKSCIRNETGEFNNPKSKNTNKFSFKRKITKKFSLRISAATTVNRVVESPCDNYGLDSLFSVDKNSINKYDDNRWTFSTLHKIMDKPLGWLKIKTNKKSKLRRKSTTNFNTIDKKIPIIVPKKEFILTAPSMSSSINYEKVLDESIQAQYHSTPQSQIYSQFSPILSASSLKNSLESSLTSTPITSSSTSRSRTNKSIFSYTPCLSRRLSFGITSSPKPLNTNVPYDEHSISHNYQNNSNYYDEHQQKLINHLNSIKQSVKIGVELRNLKTFNNENASFKEWAHKNTVKETGVCRVLSKRKKLQKIFQIKLRKQLKEMKKWQVGIKSDFEMEHNNDCFNSNICNSVRFSADYFRNSTNNLTDTQSFWISSNQTPTCQCSCLSNHNLDKQNIILFQNTYKFIDCVKN